MDKLITRLVSLATAVLASAFLVSGHAQGEGPPADCPCDISPARLLDAFDGWDSSASYECKEIENFDRSLPPSPFPFGLDNTILAQTRHPTSDPDSSFVTIDASLRTFVNFSCEYHAHNGHVREIVSEFNFSDNPDYGDMVADFIEKYDACKSAIGTLVDKFPFGSLSSNNCAFD